MIESTNKNIYANRDKRIAVITAIVLFLTAIAGLFISLGTVRVTAETRAGKANTVTLHVYDTGKKYDTLGTWIWVRGGSGKPTENGYLDPDEGFSKPAEGNTAYSFDSAFSAADMEKFKSGTLLGLLVCTNDPSASGATVWGNYKKETADVFVDISGAIDANNHADVYYVRGDTVAYTDVEAAKMALEKVKSARFTAKTANSVEVAFSSTTMLTADTVGELYQDGKKVGETQITLPDSATGAVYDASAVFEKIDFDFAASYMFYIKGVPTGAAVSMNAFIDDVEFIKTYENEDTQSLDYGAFYTPESTLFRVWAPFATSVKLNLYDNGSAGEAISVSPFNKRIPQGGKWGGVWEFEYKRDLAGLYYTFTIDNGGIIVETMDSYARAAGANGLRGMILDLDTTDPEGWENDDYLYNLDRARADVPIVWEIQVKDFSSSPDSGMKYKGKYLAFTEENTTVPGKPNLKTGLDYLKDLGITYVHLNPVYDFATIDESDMSIADDTHDAFNWGYDPQNYNVPEGSYSTDPSRGEVRINEFKQMVMALHKAGIGVIMDVVYNHTYATNGQALNDTVPDYYHRTNENGGPYDNSGCGNSTASERTMMRKYMVDSLIYWAKEYHIDGFRFDLMGAHDTRTVNIIRDALDQEVGEHILMYGEPWAGRSGTAPSFTKRVNATSAQIPGTGKYTYNGDNGYGSKANKMFNDEQADWNRILTDCLKDRVAIFDDKGRNGLRGDGNKLDTERGWLTDNLGAMSNVQAMMEGHTGSTGKTHVMRTASQNVAYAAAHDNYTLWDQLVTKRAGEETTLFYDYPDAGRIAKCKLAASAYLLSGGIPFMLAGEEMGRTKYGNHNSYNSPSKVNQLVWSRQENFADLLNTFKQLIKLRLDNRETFSYFTASVQADASYYEFSGSGDGKIVFQKYIVGNTNLSGWLDAVTNKGHITDGKTTIDF